MCCQHINARLASAEVIISMKELPDSAVWQFYLPSTGGCGDLNSTIWPVD